MPKKKSTEKAILKVSHDIQAARESLGLTQEELAEKIDVSVESIRAIEQNRRAPSLLMLYKICRALNVKITIG